MFRKRSGLDLPINSLCCKRIHLPQKTHEYTSFAKKRRLIPVSLLHQDLYLNQILL